MNYKVVAVPKFKKELKKLVKKYHSLKDEFAALLDSLETEPAKGTVLGNNCYKIRLSIKSKGKGKSGGARVITNVVVLEDTVYLLSIYDKVDKDNLTDKELKALLDSVPK